MKEEKYKNLDYGIQDPKERIEIVNKILEETDPNELTPKYMETLSDYILFAMTKKEKKNREIITPNRKITIDKRETSYEGLVDKLENGEQGVHTLITNDKNIIFNHAIKITEDDIKDIPTMRDLVDSIKKITKQYENASGRRKKLLKRQIIQLSKDQYVLKSIFKKGFYLNHKTRDLSQKDFLDLTENIYLNSFGEVKSDSPFSLVNKESVSKILKEYDKLFLDSADSFNSDMKWLADELKHFIKRIKEDEPLYYDLIRAKVQGMQNIEIQELLEQKYGVKHSLEYISSLWKHKIPKMISEYKKEEWLIWYYKNHKSKDDWKACTRCKTIKPKHNKFFSKNKTSKDGLYSICKCCRNKK